MKTLERSVCCCMKCENVQLKLKIINQCVTKDCKIESLNDLSNKTVCQYEEPGFPERECVERTCKSCGTDALATWYAPMIAVDGDRQVQYDQWKTVEEVKPIKTKGEKAPVMRKIKALRLVTSKTSCKELLAGLIVDMKLFSGHLFRAAWQQEQFRLSKLNMPPRSAVLVADFAENYACAMANEVQSYHWAQTQVTIHPVMAFVNAADENSPTPTHTEAVFCITDDPKHDAASVSTFMHLTNEYLKDKYNIKSEVIFTDCCASQYRGKVSFADISFMKQDSDLDVTRHYFESSHGKSAADGLAAIVKHSATVAVTRSHVKIRNAKEFHTYCVDNLEQVGNSVYPSRADAYKSASRNFILVEHTQINRDRIDREVHAVKGTMKIHSITPTGLPYELKTRDISCFCDYCYHGQDLRCKNIRTVGEWSPCRLKPTSHASTNHSTNNRIF